MSLYRVDRSVHTQEWFISVYIVAIYKIVVNRPGKYRHKRIVDNLNLEYFV